MAESSGKNIYHSPLEIMDDYGAWFAALCLRYIRQYSDFLINDFGGFAPATPSLSEIVRLLCNENSDVSQKWFDEHEVPSLKDLSEGLAVIMSSIHARTEATFESCNGENLDKCLPGEYLKQAFGLESYEIEILMVLALVQYDDRYARIWRYVSGAPEYAPLNASYIQRLFDFVEPEKLRHTLSMQSALRRNVLISVGIVPSWKSDTPLAYAPIILPNRILSFLLGESDDIDIGGIRMLRNREDDRHQANAIDKELSRLLSKRSVRLGLIGYSGLGRTTALCRIANKLGLRVLEIDLNILLEDNPEPSSITDFLCTVLRETRLQKALLLFRFMEISDQPKLSRFAHIIYNILSSDPCSRFCVTLPHQTSLSREVFGELNEIIFPEPTRDDQEIFWKKNLSHYLPDEDAQNVAADMADGYCLSDAEVRAAIEQTLTRLASLSPHQALTAECLTDTLNKTRGTALEGLATLRSTTLKLQDVVLSSDIRQTLNEILAYARYRETVMNDWGFAKYNMSGAGLSVLLSGLPGTGKTMTAQVLAHELKRALYVVDLSRVVDKYIGETEKRLAKIFDEAERSQAMLLFDEADSLFAKRTSVKSSNDRYANLEVNYLLQRLEAYSGVSILTTNFAGGLDEALARRIQFKINFPMPDKMQRIELWKRLVPPKAPLADDVCFEALAERFEMSGGHIKNAVFRASIQAASEHTKITHDLLWDAALNEFREMGHIVRDVYDEGDYV
ncbi:MAG: AAA family ATPase [Proteobacteria bacterium]|nr:AAA family ATPase [Pseudomonadota bacterium]